MIPSTETSVYRMRTRHGDNGGQGSSPVAGEEAVEAEKDEGEYVLCRQCRQFLTTTASRITVEGSHLHTFANPHGIIFEIGCFGAAQGTSNVGLETDEWTWFRGFSWRVTVCAKCLSHLGWFFRGSGAGFFGLILNSIAITREP